MTKPLHVVSDQTSGYFIVFEKENEDPPGNMSAGVNWDGCTHLRLDVGTEDECYHHICDLAGFIATLQAIHKNALYYFDGEFGVSCVSEEDRLRRLATLETAYGEKKT